MPRSGRRRRRGRKRCRDRCVRWNSRSRPTARPRLLTASPRWLRRNSASPTSCPRNDGGSSTGRHPSDSSRNHPDIQVIRLTSLLDANIISASAGMGRWDKASGARLQVHHLDPTTEDAHAGCVLARIDEVVARRVRDPSEPFSHAGRGEPLHDNQRIVHRPGRHPKPWSP